MEQGNHPHELFFVQNRQERYLLINYTTCTIGVHIAQNVQEGNSNPAGCPGEVGMADFGGCHEAVHETVLLGHLLLEFWYWHQAVWVLGHFSGFYHTLLFPPRPCQPQDVFPSLLIGLTSCSCSWDTGSVGGTSDLGLSRLHIYPFDSCVLGASLTCQETCILFFERGVLLTLLDMLLCTCDSPRWGLRWYFSQGHGRG